MTELTVKICCGAVECCLCLHQIIAAAGFLFFLGVVAVYVITEKYPFK